MHTYWLNGPTQIYRTLLETASDHPITISDLQLENKEQPLISTLDSVTSTNLKVPNVMSPMSRAKSSTKSNVINKMKEAHSTCPFSGVHFS